MQRLLDFLRCHYDNHRGSGFSYLIISGSRVGSSWGIAENDGESNNGFTSLAKVTWFCQLSSPDGRGFTFFSIGDWGDQDTTHASANAEQMNSIVGKKVKGESKTVDIKLTGFADFVRSSRDVCRLSR